MKVNHLNLTLYDELPEDLRGRLSEPLRDDFRQWDLLVKAKAANGWFPPRGYKTRFDTDPNKSAFHVEIATLGAELMMRLVEESSPSPYRGVALCTAHAPFRDYEMVYFGNHAQETLPIFRKGTWDFVDYDYGKDTAKDERLLQKCRAAGLEARLVSEDIKKLSGKLKPNSYDLATHMSYCKFKTDIPIDLEPEVVYTLLKPGKFYMVTAGSRMLIEENHSHRFEKVFEFGTQFTHFAFPALYRKIPVKSLQQVIIERLKARK